MVHLLLALCGFALASLATLVAARVFAAWLDRLGARLGFSEALLGVLTAVAADGPELSSAVTALARGEHDVGLGVVLGSNAFNLAAMLGGGAILCGALAPRRPALALEAVAAGWTTAVARSSSSATCRRSARSSRARSSSCPTSPCSSWATCGSTSCPSRSRPPRPARGARRRLRAPSAGGPSRPALAAGRRDGSGGDGHRRRLDRDGRHGPRRRRSHAPFACRRGAPDPRRRDLPAERGDRAPPRESGPRGRRRLRDVQLQHDQPARRRHRPGRDRRPRQRLGRRPARGRVPRRDDRGGRSPPWRGRTGSAVAAA